MVESAVLTVFIVFGVGPVLLYLSLLQKMFSVLEAEEPVVWAELGKPHVILNNTPRTGLAAVTFLVKRGYRNLESERARRAGRMAAASFVLAGIVVSLWFALVVTLM